MSKPCHHCGHLKGRHGHRINHAVPPYHPHRVRYYCVGDCFCTSHSDYDFSDIGIDILRSEEDD